MTRLALVLPALILAVPAPARAQANTGTGGGPASTLTAPNTSALGRTMPPAGGGARTSEDRRDRTGQERADDKITRGICIGCGPK